MFLIQKPPLATAGGFSIELYSSCWAKINDRLFFFFPATPDEQFDTFEGIEACTSYIICSYLCSK